MPPVSPRKMRSVFLEEGKIGNLPSGNNIKGQKGDQIQREFYIDSGVCYTVSFGLSCVAELITDL